MTNSPLFVGGTVSMHDEALAERVQIAVGTLDEPDRLPRFAASSTAVSTSADQGDMSR